MQAYIISYDLNREHKDYKSLFDEIKSISKIYCKPCKSTWIIASEIKSAKKIYEKLREKIDDDDYIVVSYLESKVYAQPDNESKADMKKYFMINKWDELFDKCQLNFDIPED